MSDNIRFISPFGVEITYDNSPFQIKDINTKQIKKLMSEHKIVIIRGLQNISELLLIQFAERIGPLLAWDFGVVMNMRVQAKPKNYLFTHGPVPFHWDGAFYKEPQYLLFHCVDAPLESCGGETLFTNTNAIWQKASRDHKLEWKDIKLCYKTEKLAHYGGEIHVPFLQTHPITNETILRFAEPVPNTMLNPVTVTIDNMNNESTKVWLDNMAACCYLEDYCYIHSWKKNDILIADNFSLIHARRAFKQFSPRFLRRIQIL